MDIAMYLRNNVKWKKQSTPNDGEGVVKLEPSPIVDGNLKFFLDI